jgi:predicted metal-dependent hydrolase
VTRKNRRGAHKMLLRARQWLAMLPDVCQGVDVAKLRRDAFKVQAVLEELTDDQMDRFDAKLLKPVKLK